MEGDTILLFSLGIAHYGIDVRDVVEVVPGESVTPAPGAPPFIRGVVAAGGEILPVINLRKKFISAAAPDASGGKVIIAKVGDARYGLYVDSVGKIVEGAAELPIPDVVAGIKSEFVSRLLESEHGVIIVLQLDRLLTEEEVMTARQVGEAP